MGGAQMEKIGTRVADDVAEAAFGATSTGGITAKVSGAAYRPVASFWHTVLVLLVQGVLSYRGAIRVGKLHAVAEVHRAALYERTMISEWMMLGLVLVGVWWHGSSLLTVLGERWHSLGRFLRDLGIAIVFLMATIAIGSVFGHGRGDDSAARFILPQGRSEMWLWVALSVTAGICEEAIFRGYFQQQFIAVTKNAWAGICLSAALFGAAHLYQGITHALQIGLLGVMGGMLAYWCKSVRPGMIAHSLQDMLGGLARHQG
jgi:membrane protease YdiL (CAAX protease family)